MSFFFHPSSTFRLINFKKRKMNFMTVGCHLYQSLIISSRRYQSNGHQIPQDQV
ncbi:hypothetical protein Hanom_Chr14g01309141 [Helianthus anomalus]